MPLLINFIFGQFHERSGMLKFSLVILRGARLTQWGQILPSHRVGTLVASKFSVEWSTIDEICNGSLQW